MTGLPQSLGALWLRATEFVGGVLQGDGGEEDGQGMVEYALILVLIAIVVIVILQVVGKQVNNVFSNVSNGLSH
jgi:pilus assembly protein Flp/PilA